MRRSDAILFLCIMLSRGKYESARKNGSYGLGKLSGLKISPLFSGSGIFCHQ